MNPSGGVTIEVGDTYRETLSGNINDGILTKTGAGALFLTGDNLNIQGALLMEGRIDIDNFKALGYGPPTTLTMADGTTLGFVASFTFLNDIILDGAATFDTGGNASTLAGVISGTGSLIKTGTGTLTLSAANTYTGITEVKEETLVLGSSGSIIPSLDGGGLVLSGGTFNFYSTVAPLTIPKLTVNDDVNSSWINGSSSLFTDLLTFNFSPATVNSNRTMLYAGNTDITGATFNLNMSPPPGSPLQPTDKIILIQSSGSITGLPNTTVTPGAYTFELSIDPTGSSGEQLIATVIAIGSPSAPVISGPTGLTLAEGYAAISTDVFTITGSSPLTVTKISGNAAITWNNSTNKLDIAAGLSAGDYEVKLEATNSVSNYIFTFTLYVQEPVYYIDNPEYFNGGKVISYPQYLAKELETVTLTITPYTGYELQSITVSHMDNSSVVLPVHGTDLTRSFMMPAHHVSIAATFQKNSVQSAWEKAIPLIEGTTFILTQKEAPDANQARFPLAMLINELIAETGFVISAYDIVIYLFNTATAGDEDNPEGKSGYFEFRVTPANVTPSAYSSGIITPTPFDTSANDEIGQSHGLRAFTMNGKLHVKGLAPGKLWYVYGLSGTLIHTAIASCDEEEIPLAGGVYVVVAPGGGTIKVVVF